MENFIQKNRPFEAVWDESLPLLDTLGCYFDGESEAKNHRQGACLLGFSKKNTLAV